VLFCKVFVADGAHMRAVLATRLAVSELALEAAQTALLHTGARGYIEGSAVHRRLRESYFVAIVTPSVRHLRMDLAGVARS
jgi:alkylation response protein AidB-like acyl-CoA dehydrogenase